MRRASLGSPVARGSPEAHRTPCPTTHVHTPRRVSNSLGKGGIFFGSTETVCKSYINTNTNEENGTSNRSTSMRKTTLRKGGLLFGCILYTSTSPRD